MKIKEIVVKKETKLSINYNSVSSSIILTAEVEENENIDEVHNELSEKVDKMLLEDITKQIKLIQ